MLLMTSCNIHSNTVDPYVYETPSVDAPQTLPVIVMFHVANEAYNITSGNFTYFSKTGTIVLVLAVKILIISTFTLISNCYLEAISSRGWPSCSIGSVPARTGTDSTQQKKAAGYRFGKTCFYYFLLIIFYT